MFGWRRGPFYDAAELFWGTGAGCCLPRASCEAPASEGRITSAAHTAVAIRRTSAVAVLARSCPGCPIVAGAAILAVVICATGLGRPGTAASLT